MPNEDELQALKSRLATHLLALEGVSAVGIRGGALAVYLASDTEAVRHAVRDVIDRHAPGVEFNTFAGGRFERQG